MPYVGTKLLARQLTPAGGTPKRFTYNWAAGGANFLVGGYTPCQAPTPPATVLDVIADPGGQVPFYAANDAPFQYQATVLYNTPDAQNLTNTTMAGQGFASLTPIALNNIDTDAYVQQPALVPAGAPTMLQLGNGLNPGFGIRAVMQVGTAAGNGMVTFCQFVRSQRQWTRADGTTGNRTTNGQWWLDKMFPYDDQARAYAPVTTAALGDEIFTDDTPGEGLAANELIVDVADDFRMYLMYRQGADSLDDHSIWVSLGYVQWGWNATASRPDIASPWLLPVAHSYINPFVAAVDAPVAQGVMRAAFAAMLRGGRLEAAGV